MVIGLAKVAPRKGSRTDT
ncbi:Protein of unknown function [Pyronema omphalodes CBS 100304]|uniref:Uncharacterized protein n=1 Tax=Pyronema omphalodes (strain CBS 100304) TaxID=1076935 RepID=U4KY67_PYROM|nr:Protein of unknown function [Pyronema omphalodes CBS 100304]